MANLFTGDLTQVTLSDIEQFLNLKAPPSSRTTEGPRLDFKQDLPPDLGWHVAGLANTYGGILLIGIEAEKTNRNVPKSILGADLGNDPRARLTDKILASVHPRPDFHVQPIGTPGTQKSVAIVRVAVGTYPPYESSRGGSPGIPVRIEDTTRQATLQEIEPLLRNRELAANEPGQRLEQYMQASHFFCTVEAPQPQSMGLIADHFFHKITIAPRVPARLRLDSAFERNLVNLLREVYRGEQNFTRARNGESWKEGFSRYSHVLQYEFRISGRAPCHRLWRVWTDGALGFVANHSRIQSPEPAGNVALEAILFLRLTRRLFENWGYLGPSVIADQLACPSHKFSAEFPIADVDYSGKYDGVDGLYFDDPAPGQDVEAFSVEELAYDTVLEPEEFVASTVLEQLRAIAGARIEYRKLLHHVTRLSKDFP